MRRRACETSRQNANTGPCNLSETVLLCLWRSSWGAGRCTRRRAGSHATPKGGDKMPITLTFHVLFWTVTIRVKSRNRHPGR